MFPPQGPQGPKSNDPFGASGANGGAPEGPPPDAMFEHFLEGDEELEAALTGTEGDEVREGSAATRGDDVLSAGLQFVKHMRDMR